MRHALRVDDCQKPIVDALRRAGVAVYVVGLPLDLLCAVRRSDGSWGTLLLEVKDEDGRITKTQAEFMATWPGEFHIVRSEAEAMKACFGDLMK